MVLTFNFLAVLDFMNDEATDDACVVASYLSDADFLLASLSRILTRNYEAENVVQSSATSVAVRGVLFANFHPLSARYFRMYCFFLSFFTVVDSSFFKIMNSSDHAGGIPFDDQVSGKLRNHYGIIRSVLI